MPKNHRAQPRPKHLSQTSSVSSSYTYTLDAGGSASDSMALQNPSDDPEEDHNFVCLTCLGECTCGGDPPPAVTTTTAPTSSPGLTHGPSHSFSAHPTDSAFKRGQSTASFKPPLKIKLTLRPPRPSPEHTLPKHHAPDFPSSHRNKYAKQSETTSASESAGGDPIDGSPFSAPGRHLPPSSLLNADGSVKKKRGRPTKAAIAAREAAAARAASLGFPSPSTTTGALPDAITCLADNHRQHPRNVSPARQTSLIKSMKSSRISSSSRIHPASKAQPKKRQLTGAAAASRAASQKKQKHKALKKKKPPVWLGDEGEESSELSELDDEAASDSGHSLRFPTFISAFSTSPSNSSGEDTSDTDSDDEQRKAAAMPDVYAPDLSPLRKVSSSSVRNNWEIRPRMRSVGAEGTSDEDTESESDEEEEEEEEEGGEEEATASCDVGDVDGQELEEDIGEEAHIDSLIRYAGIATGYTDDDEESSYDADLFFANLTDSSGDDSDDRMGDAENGFGDDDMQDEDMDVVMGSNEFSTFGSMSLPEVAAAAFLTPFGELERNGVDALPFDIAHGWDSQILFSSFLKSDNELPELSADSQLGNQNRSDSQISSNKPIDVNVLEDTDIMMATSEEEEAVAMFDIEFSGFEDDVVEIFEDSDGGETTEDEFVEIDGIATPRNMVDLRFPASLGSINPMSTVSSPVVSPGPRGKTFFSSARSARPADILAGRVQRLTENSEELCSTSAPTPSSRGPTMGSFAAKEGTKRKVVLDNTGRTGDGKPAPSPFPVIRRLRRQSVGSGNSSEAGSAVNSLLGASRTLLDPVIEGAGSPSKSPELPPTQPIELDEVLHTAFLDADVEVTGTSTDVSCDTDIDVRNKHIQNLRRWDRIPMNTFRKSRAVASVPEVIIPDKLGVAGWMSPSTRVPRPADGFSYGSSAGAMLRGSSLGAALFNGETSTQGSSKIANQRRRMTGKGRSSIPISPLFMPVGDRDGDRTPTNDQQSYQRYAYQQHALVHAANTKSKKELRRQKKRQRHVGAGSPASRHLQHQHHHNHFPNGKSRGSNSFQRSLSGSIPTISI